MANKNGQGQPGVSLAGAVDLGALRHQVDAEPGQQGGAPAAGGYVIDTTEASFQAMVQTSTTFPILVLLWVPTDDRLFPLATRLAQAVNAQEGRIQLSRIDIASNPQIAQTFQVQGAPALFALLAGRPMPILQGLPTDEEMNQITDQLIPQVIQMAQKAGITGSAPYQETNDQGQDEQASQSAADAIPPAHQEAHRLAQEGDYAAAAEAYRKLVQADSTDDLAKREQAKCLLMARSAKADVRKVRQAAADAPDDLQAQLDVADVDMIGGQIQDAFDRLLDFLAGHRDQTDPIRRRLLEYFVIPEPTDPRLAKARRRLSTLMY